MKNSCERDCNEREEPDEESTDEPDETSATAERTEIDCPVQRLPDNNFFPEEREACMASTNLADYPLHCIDDHDYNFNSSLNAELSNIYNNSDIFSSSPEQWRFAPVERVDASINDGSL